MMLCEGMRIGMKVEPASYFELISGGLGNEEVESFRHEEFSPLLFGSVRDIDLGCNSQVLKMHRGSCRLLTVKTRTHTFR